MLLKGNIENYNFKVFRWQEERKGSGGFLKTETETGKVSFRVTGIQVDGEISLETISKCRHKYSDLGNISLSGKIFLLNQFKDVTINIQDKKSF